MRDAMNPSGQTLSALINHLPKLFRARRLIVHLCTLLPSGALSLRMFGNVHKGDVMSWAHAICSTVCFLSPSFWAPFVVLFVLNISGSPTIFSCTRFRKDVLRCIRLSPHRLDETAVTEVSRGAVESPDPGLPTMSQRPLRVTQVYR